MHALLKEIDRTGHVALHNIYFAFNKSDLKPESAPVIKEIAKLLKENPKFKLHIIGHTDNIGNLNYNMKLSKERAKSIARELTTEYGISPKRLKAFGSGPLCPVASNDSEEGRAKNRRVELVKQ